MFYTSVVLQVLSTFGNVIRICISFLLFLLLLSSCRNKSQRNVQELLQQNHFDLPNPKSFAAGGIRFTSSDLFEEIENEDLLLSQKGKVYWIGDINVWLSVEHIEYYHVYSATERKNPRIEEVFSYLMNLRKNTITYHSCSEVNNIGHRNLRIANAVIDGSDMYGEVLETYDMGLVQKGEKFYLFQLYGSEKGIAYLHDDLIRILKSVQ